MGGGGAEAAAFCTGHLTLFVVDLATQAMGDGHLGTQAIQGAHVTAVDVPLRTADVVIPADWPLSAAGTAAATAARASLASAAHEATRRVGVAIFIVAAAWRTSEVSCGRGATVEAAWLLPLVLVPPVAVRQRTPVVLSPAVVHVVPRGHGTAGLPRPADASHVVPSAVARDERAVGLPAAVVHVVPGGEGAA